MTNLSALDKLDLSQLPGILVVVSGPAGSGKNTLVNALLDLEGDRFWESISCTSRPLRPGEADGEHYHQLSRAEFQQRAEAGYFLEWAEFSNNLYGTPAQPVIDHLKDGTDVLVIAEVQGAAQIRQRVSDALTIFILPEGDNPAAWEHHLRQRLERRGTESPEQVERRLHTALTRELPEAGNYQYQVTNHDGQLAATTQQLHLILEQAHREHAARLVA